MEDFIREVVNDSIIQEPGMHKFREDFMLCLMQMICAVQSWSVLFIKQSAVFPLLPAISYKWYCLT